MNYELFEMCVKGESQTMLRKALEVAFTGSTTGDVTHYHKTAGYFELHSYEMGDAKPLPVAMNYEMVGSMFLQWLYNEAAYPPAPDTDGDANKGFTLEVFHGGSVMRLVPSWTIYGK